MKTALDKTDPDRDSELRKAIALLHAHLPSSDINDIEKAANLAADSLEPLDQVSAKIYEKAIGILFGQKPSSPPKKKTTKTVTHTDMLSQILSQ